MSDATIRPAERGDIAAVGGIYAEAVKNGTVTFETDPPDSSNNASIALHPAFGFRLIGRLQSVGFKHGRWLDTVIMQRELGRGDATAP